MAPFYETISVENWRPNLEKELPFSCPICGRKTEYPLAKLKKGAVLTCPFCKLALTLHGHMLEEVKNEIQKIRKKS